MAKINIKILSLILFCFFISGCFSGKIQGVVFNASNGFGISSAKVEVLWKGSVIASTTTLPDGSYSLNVNIADESSSALNFLVSFTKNQYATFETQATVNNLGTLKLDAGLTPLDFTPPTTPIVTDDGETTTSTNFLHFSFSSEDPESGIVEYHYSIGTAPYRNDVLGLGLAGQNTEITCYNLNLAIGQTYYVNVRAKNGVGLYSEFGVSDGIRVVGGPLTIDFFYPDNKTKYFVSQKVDMQVGLRGGTPPLTYKFLVDGQLKQSGSAAFFSWPTGLESSGKHILRVEVQDSVGNSTSAEREIFIYRFPIPPE